MTYTSVLVLIVTSAVFGPVTSRAPPRPGIELLSFETEEEYVSITTETNTDPLEEHVNKASTSIITIGKSNGGAGDNDTMKRLVNDLEKTVGDLEVLKKAIAEHLRNGHGIDGEESTRIPVPDTKKKYYFGRFFKANFYNARLYCKHRGMELASIESAEEQEQVETAVNNVVTGCDVGPIWTSGSRVGESEVRFSWSSGSPVSYTKWEKREPTSSDSKNCLAIFKTPLDYRWYSKSCGDLYYFVCQYYNQKNCHNIV